MLSDYASDYKGSIDSLNIVSTIISLQSWIERLSVRMFCCIMYAVSVQFPWVSSVFVSSKRKLFVLELTTTVERAADGRKQREKACPHVVPSCLSSMRNLRKFTVVSNL